MSLERRETEDCLDVRVLAVARVILVLVVPMVLSALLVPPVFLALKDRKVQRDHMVQQVRRETMD